MEEVQGLQNIRKDGSALSSWPPLQPCKYFPQTPGQSYSFVAPNFSENGGISQSSWEWENLSQSDAVQSPDPRARQWQDSWEWDSFSFAARPTPSTLALDIAQTDALPSVDPEMGPVFPSDLPEQNDLGPESTALGLGPKTFFSKDDGFLALKLGGNSSSVAEDDHPSHATRSRLSPPDNQQPRCQVDNCRADLRNNAKDYHRRHKVCEFHAKALKAPVLRIMQRFCQQCSRFHSLQEFDEDRRSCRRRLAGHNRRRRKTQPDAAAALAYLLADQNPLTRLINNASGQLQGTDELERLLRLLSGGDALLQNLLRAKGVVENPESRHPETGGGSNELADAIARSQIISNLLLSNSSLVHNLSSVVSTESLNAALSKALLLSLQQVQQNSGQANCMPSYNQQDVPSIDEHGQQLLATINASDKNNGQNVSHAVQQNGSRGLNCSSLQQDRRCMGDINIQKKTSHFGAVTEPRKSLLRDSKRLKTVVLCQGEEHSPFDPQNSPPEEQGDTPVLGSDPSSDSGPDMQDRTDRIMFKLLDRGPEELPASLRKQIFDWLDHLPVDMESYIRPGCVILTVFICMPTIAWEMLCGDIERSLLKLVQSTSGEFWKRGRVFVQIGSASASIIEGRVLSNMNLSSIRSPHVRLVRPSAIVMGENVELIVTGHNLEVPGTKLIFAYGGKHIDKEVNLLGQQDTNTVGDGHMQDHSMAVAQPHFETEQTLTFCVGPFNCMGRGFIEVQGLVLEGNSFPIIVADRSICQEIFSLEKLESSAAISDMFGKGKRKEAITHFLHELGWLFQRNQWKMSHRDVVVPTFSSDRFSWLLRFAVEQSCCAIVKQVLDLMFGMDGESLESAHSRAQIILSEINLLHIAVRTNSRQMVETLLGYSPPNTVYDSPDICIFKPDKVGLANLTPLHIAASMHSADEIVDALTNAPEKFWASAWTNAKDSVSQTPLMYALAAGNHSYVKIVQSKLQKPHSVQVLVEGTRSGVELNNQLSAQSWALRSFQPEDRDVKLEVRSSSQRLLLKNTLHSCTCKGGKLSSQNTIYRVSGIAGFKHNPFVVSLLAVAALCVCVGILIRSPPFVAFVRPPFVWDKVFFGTL